MSTSTAGIAFLALLVLALVAVHVPLGDYMYRVYTSPKDWRVEKIIYRVIGADGKAQQPWYAYARSVLAFSAVSVLFLFFFELLQDKLPLHLHNPATPMRPALAWNTAISFVTNTNWQAYSGESTQGHLVQMAGLAVQNFVSAAVGMAVAIAASTADAPAGPGSGGHMAGMAGLAQSATPRSPRRRARLRETVLSRKEVPCSVMARFPRRWTRSRIVSGISAPRKPPFCHRGGCRSNAGTPSGNGVDSQTAGKVIY